MQMPRRLTLSHNTYIFHVRADDRHKSICSARENAAVKLSTSINADSDAIKHQQIPQNGSLIVPRALQSTFNAPVCVMRAPQSGDFSIHKRIERRRVVKAAESENRQLKRADVRVMQSERVANDRVRREATDQPHLPH
jgi:hypothetical protein